MRYASANANLTFEYPSNWSVTDNTFVERSLDPDGQIYTYTNLTVCPSGDDLRVAQTDKGGDNCITFYTKSRMLHPPLGMIDERDLFASLAYYIDADSGMFSGTRVLQQESMLNEGYQIGMTGVYREGNDFVALREQFCAISSAVCLLEFKHVLGSIIFTK